jgi:hypothetical protein
MARSSSCWRSGWVRKPLCKADMCQARMCVTAGVMHAADVLLFVEGLVLYGQMLCMTVQLCVCVKPYSKLGIILQSASCPGIERLYVLYL